MLFQVLFCFSRHTVKVNTFLECEHRLSVLYFGALKNNAHIVLTMSKVKIYTQFVDKKIFFKKY